MKKYCLPLLNLLVLIGCAQDTEIDTSPMDFSHHPVAPFLDDLKLIQEVNCAQEIDHFQVLNGNVEIQEILGRQCLVMEPERESTHLYYRLGKHVELEAGKPYFLEIEYPDDSDRSFVVQNRGAEYARGFHTGSTLGDGYNPPYVQSNPESISIPNSYRYLKWRTLFWLHDRYTGLKQPRDKGERPETPDDGFLVILSQYDKKNNPLNKGIAISKIRLYEAPAMDSLKLDINYPPKDLPRRHTFFREEMADWVVNNDPPGVNEPIEWFERKAQLMNFLGMNTYAKDLLEFGHNQGWEPMEYGWIYSPKWKSRWREMIDMLERYDLYVLPYYEYAGSIGPKGLGKQKRAHPLDDNLPNHSYTHIKWSEKANVDITDSATFADFKKVLDRTILRHKDKVQFIGAWMRTRISQIPISFADATIQRFEHEVNDGKRVTREMLKKNKNLYNRYLDWWFDKRKAFLIAMRNYLRNAGGIQDAVLLYTADHTESGKTHHAWGYKHHILTDDLDKWDDYNYPAFKLNDYIKKDWHLEAMLLPENTWGEWEWHHSVPPPDPDNYKDVEGVMMTYTFNKAYTVGSEKAFETFTTPSGLAMIRHYCLNEDGIEGTGYFVADIDWHGPYTVLAEARAMAYGNPRYMGYLASSAFNRAGLAYVRDFNANFLALPALPSTILEKASKNDDIVVREIPTDRHGTYLAVVNTALTNKKNVKISLPNRSDVQDATTGEYLYRNVNEIHLDMWPAQLASFILSAPLEE